MGVQLAEGVYIVCRSLGRVDGRGAEAGEGQVSAKLPDVLLLWMCAEELLCCEWHEWHGNPNVEEGLPRSAPGLQQAADDLGLEGCKLGSDVNNGNAILIKCSAGNISAGV